MTGRRFFLQTVPDRAGDAIPHVQTRTWLVLAAAAVFTSALTGCSKPILHGVAVANQRPTIRLSQFPVPNDTTGTYVYELSWIVGRLLVRVPFISLVNLLAGRKIVPELLQRQCTGDRIAERAQALLTSAPEREAQLEGMREIRQRLAPAGAPRAARRAAEVVAELLGSAR